MNTNLKDGWLLMAEPNMNFLVGRNPIRILYESQLVHGWDWLGELVELHTTSNRLPLEYILFFWLLMILAFELNHEMTS